MAFVPDSGTVFREYNRLDTESAMKCVCACYEGIDPAHAAEIAQQLSGTVYSIDVQACSLVIAPIETSVYKKLPAFDNAIITWQLPAFIGTITATTRQKDGNGSGLYR